MALGFRISSLGFSMGFLTVPPSAEEDGVTVACCCACGPAVHINIISHQQEVLTKQDNSHAFPSPLCHCISIPCS